MHGETDNQRQKLASVSNPCQLLFCPQREKEEEESKGPRSTGNCFSEERQHFLSQYDPSPTLTSCSDYIYPAQMCPCRLPAALLPATWSCHSAGTLKREFIQRTEPRNHYTLIHASSIASPQSKVRQNTDSITPVYFGSDWGGERNFILYSC